MAADPSLDYLDGVLFSLHQGLFISGRMTDDESKNLPVRHFNVFLTAKEAKERAEADDEKPLKEIRTPKLTADALSRHGDQPVGGSNARSARAPWPISRRFGDPTRPVSPVEYGGKL